MKKTYISFYSASWVVLGQGGLKPSRTTCFLTLNRKERKKKTKTTTMELQIPMPSPRLNYGIWTIKTALKKKKFISPSPSLKKTTTTTTIYVPICFSRNLILFACIQAFKWWEVGQTLSLRASAKEECRWTLGQNALFPLSFIFIFLPRRYMSSNQLLQDYTMCKKHFVRYGMSFSTSESKSVD